MKKRRTLIVITVCLALIGTTAAVFGSGVVEQIQTGMLLNEAISAQNEPTPVSDEEIVAAVRYGKTGTDMKRELRKKGYYEDEINAAMKKHVEAAVMYNMSTKESEYIVALVDQGYEYEKLMDIYHFLTMTKDGIEYVQQIYDAASEFDSKFWIETAYDELKHRDDLAFEDVATYIEQGISVDEIMFAYEMSLQGNLTERQILDRRINGESWAQLSQEGYGWYDADCAQMTEGFSVKEINAIAIVCRKTQMNPRDVMDGNGGKRFNREAMDLYRNKTQRIEELHQQLELGETDAPDIMEQAKEVIPGVEGETIRTLLNENYRIKDIKAALVDGENKSETARKIADAVSAMEEGGER